MEEYEHSFKVTSITPFIEFCNEHSYKQISVSTQNRKVYESAYNPHLISRLTINKMEDKTTTYFDFKLSGKEIDGKKLSQESETLLVTDEMQSFVASTLEILSFKLVADNFRTRYVFANDDIIFEIDDYTTPNMKVLAVEGNKDKVEYLCNNQLKALLDKYALNPV